MATAREFEQYKDTQRGSFGKSSVSLRVYADGRDDFLKIPLQKPKELGRFSSPRLFYYLALTFPLTADDIWDFLRETYSGMCFSKL